LDFEILALCVDNWNDDLSPWKAEPVFGKEGFGGKAEETLKFILSNCMEKDRLYYIGGYSLAGLFALWSVRQTNLFKAVAAASPSVWFPGFTDYFGGGTAKCESVYLSLGDKEAKTRNPVMSKVEDCILKTYGTLQKNGIKSILEWNEGNHFKDAEIRTAKAFGWMLNA